MTKATVEIPDIIGLPPESYTTTTLIRNSMPVMEIVPSKPNFSVGMSLFQLIPDWNTYSTLLQDHGYITKQPLKVAFVADSFPTFSLQNEYSDSFLDRALDMGSNITGEISQMMGGKTTSEAIRNVATKLKGVGGMPGAVGESVLSGMQELTALKTSLVGMGGGGIGSFMNRAGGLLNAIAANQRIDFPMIWRGSSWTPNFSFTVRLFNPNPGSLLMTQKYITGPLAALLLLMAPRSDNGSTFAWPFFHKIKCQGIFILDPAIITGLSIVEGGDQLQMGYNQRLQNVDVRIDVSSLYRSIIATKSDSGIVGRPTVSQFLDNMLDEKTLYEDPNTIKTSESRTFKKRERTSTWEEIPVLLTRSLENVSNTQASEDGSEPVNKRVSEEKKSQLKSLAWT